VKHTFEFVANGLADLKGACIWSVACEALSKCLNRCLQKTPKKFQIHEPWTLILPDFSLLKA
jgi:hypothetical protein